MSVSWRGFYAIVDPEICDPLPTTRAILQGGCGVLQLRDKRSDDREMLELAVAIASLCKAAGVDFVMNDRIDVALRVNADGVHLGQDDLPLAEARTLFSGPIGISTHDLIQARQAADAGADLIGFGPIFATATKKNADPSVGLTQLAEVCAAVPIPVVAIGGLSPDHAAALARAGASLGAAIGSVCGSPDPEAQARAFHGAWS